MNNISKLLLKKNNTESKNKAFAKQKQLQTQANMEDFGFISNSKASSLNLVGSRKTAAEILGSYADNKNLYSADDYLVTSKIVEKEILTARSENQKRTKLLNARHKTNNIVEDDENPEHYYQLYEKLLLSHRFRLRAHSERRKPRNIPEEEIRFAYEDALAYVKNNSIKANNFLDMEAEDEDPIVDNRSRSSSENAPEYSLFGTPKPNSEKEESIDEGYNSSSDTSSVSSILVADGVKEKQARKLASVELIKLKRATKIINDELSEEADFLLNAKAQASPETLPEVEAKVELFRAKVVKLRRIKGIAKRAKQQLERDDPLRDAAIAQLLQNANNRLQLQHPAAYADTKASDIDEVILLYYLNDLTSVENLIRKRKRRQNQHGN